MNSPNPHAHYLGQGRSHGMPSIIGGLGISFFVHVSIVIAMIIGAFIDSRKVEDKPIEKLMAFEPVDLVRLGVPRDKKFLPRIANPPPKTVKEKVVNLAKKRDPKDVLDKKEKPPKDAKVTKKKSTVDILNALHNPNRPVNEDKPDGRTFGVAEGTVVDDSVKHLMNTYVAQIQRAVLRKWRVPQTISESKAKSLAGKVRLKVRVSEDGYVTSYSFLRRSGDSQFDSSIETAIRSFMARYGGRRLPQPARDDIKHAVVSRGLILGRWRPHF